MWNIICLVNIIFHMYKKIFELECDDLGGIFQSHTFVVSICKLQDQVYRKKIPISISQWNGGWSFFLFILCAIPKVRVYAIHTLM